MNGRLKIPGLAGLSHGNTNISFRSGIYFIQNQFGTMD
jgi:hypothetical protein